MAVVKCCCMVVPAAPTPTHRLSLSPFDQPQAWTLSPVLYVYKPHTLVSTVDLIRTFTDSLARALVPFYPLAGRLLRIGGGRLEIDCNATGAQLVVAESDSKLDELGDFDPTPKIKHLLPNLDYSSPIESLPIVSVLVTKFSCGGFTIGSAISHSIADGSSYILFINLWAKLARGEELGENDLPCYELFKLPSNHSPTFDHPEYMPLPIVIGHTDCEEEASKDTTAAMLKVTDAQIKELKKRANRNKGVAYSTYEVVAAHTWRCACKARRGDTRQPTVTRVIVDCRGRLKPPLPRGYAGNGILTTITDVKCMFGDIIGKPLSYAAGKIREAKESFGDEYIKSALNFIESQEDVSWMRNSFHIVGSRAGQFIGNPNISVTSWMNMPLVADFGWGKPVYIGHTVLVSDGKCYVIPSSKGDGSAIVALRLQTEYMDLFKMFFHGDITHDDDDDDDVSSN